MHAENGCQHEQGTRLAVQRTDAKLCPAGNARRAAGSPRRLERGAVVTAKQACIGYTAAASSVPGSSSGWMAGQAAILMRDSAPRWCSSSTAMAMGMQPKPQLITVSGSPRHMPRQVAYSR